MQALSGMIGRKASVGGFLSPPSNPRAQPWTGGGNCQAGRSERTPTVKALCWADTDTERRKLGERMGLDTPVVLAVNDGYWALCVSTRARRTLPGLDMPRILLKERGAFGNADTGGAWLSSARATAGDKPEEGEDDVKSSCPLCPGRHTCYNGRDKGSRSREGELTPKTRPQFGLQAATRLHEAGIASNRRSAIRRRNKVAVLEGAAGSPPFQGEVMLVESEQVDRIPFFSPPCPSRAATWGRKKEREGWGFSRFWHSGPPAGGPHDGLLAQWALSHMDSSMCSSAPDPEMWIIQGTLAWRTSPEDRWGDSGEIQCRSNFLFTRGIRAVRGGPPWLLSSRESIHPLSVYGQLSLEHSHYERPRSVQWDVSIYLSLDSKWEQTCHGKEEGGNKHTWRAQYTGELYAAFGKDESLPKRNLLILSQLVGPSLVQVQDGPAAPKKRIEEASDSFIHAPLGSGGYSSVGRAPLLQLGRCDYGLDV
uniref:Uncharacterized protein ycf68 n=1 Tax=Salix viminalis TaxID=40686 RepID=A0A6N2KFV3_SALVM